MRRSPWLVVVLPVLAVGMGVALAVVATSAESTTPPLADRVDSPRSTTTAPTDYTSVYPPLGELGEPLPLPRIEIDVAALLGEPTDSGVVTGPLWISGTVVDVSAGVFENDVQQQLFKELAECFPSRDISPTPEMLYEAKNECFDYLVVNHAATQEDPSDVFMALRGLSLARPDVFTLCHNASHKVGEIALRRVVASRGLDYEAMDRLLVTGAVACQGGLVHGVYDAIGYLGLDVEDFSPAVSACERHPQLTGQCADAVGHAAWDSFNNVEDALTACGFWKAPDLQQTCAEGIIMRIYQRLEPEDEYYTGRVFGDAADDFLYNTADMCLEWPSVSIPGLIADDPRTLCYESVPYLLMKPLLALVETNGAQYEPVKEEVKRLLAVMQDACGRYGSGKTLCTQRIGSYLPGVTVYDEQATLELCAVLVDVQTECEERVRTRIERTEAGLG